MAVYSFTYTYAAVTFVVSGILSGDSITFYVRSEPYSGTMLVAESFTATGSTMTKIFSVLSAGSSYAINVEVNDVQLGTQYFNTFLARPNNWAWTSIVVSGVAIKISAQEWNSFCDRINEFRVYKGLPMLIMRYGLSVRYQDMEHCRLKQ